MIIYLSIIFFLSLFAFIEISFPKIDLKILLIFSLLVLLIITSIRYNVGPDYDSYFRYFLTIGRGEESNNDFELGYKLINNFVLTFLDNDFKNININTLVKYFTIVNFICSSIIILALYFFLKEFNYKFLALLLLFTLFIVIYVMGYVRQSVAVAITYFALCYLIKEKYFAFLFIIIIASFFHISALYSLTILFVYFIINENFKYIFFMLFLLLISCIFIFLFYSSIIDRITSLIYWYALTNTNTYISQGVYLRILSFSWVFFLFFFNFNYFIKSRESSFIISLKFNLIFLLLLLLYSFITYMNFSTIIDRLTIYLIPLHLYVIDRLIHKNIDNFFNKNLILLISFIFYVSYFSIWLIFGNNSHSYMIYSTIFSL